MLTFTALKVLPDEINTAQSISVYFGQQRLQTPWVIVITTNNGVFWCCLVLISVLKMVALKILKHLVLLLH